MSVLIAFHQLAAALYLAAAVAGVVDSYVASVDGAAALAAMRGE